MGANFGIERMNGVRDAKKMTIGITGPSENLDRDDGIEDHIGERWCPCTPNIVPFSAVGIRQSTEILGTRLSHPSPPPHPPLLYLMKPLINKVAWRKKENRKQSNTHPAPVVTCWAEFQLISVLFQRSYLRGQEIVRVLQLQTRYKNNTFTSFFEEGKILAENFLTTKRLFSVQWQLEQSG